MSVRLFKVPRPACGKRARKDNTVGEGCPSKNGLRDIFRGWRVPRKTPHPKSRVPQGGARDFEKTSCFQNGPTINFAFQDQPNVFRPGTF